MKRRIIILLSFSKLATLAAMTLSLTLFGCADRDEDLVAPGSSAEADANLAKAESIMKDIGVSISLEEIATLTNPQDLLPDPDKLVGKQAKLEEAIDSFNKVLISFGQQLSPSRSSAPLAPPKSSAGPSNSDLALIHLNLNYLYILESSSILVSVKSELYTISFPKSKQKGEVDLYKFELTKKGEEKFDELDRRNAQASDYIKAFSLFERQAIIDSIVLLTGSKVSIKANPSAGINEQGSKVDVKKHLKYALYHADQAIDFSAKISPEVKEGLDEFETTACKFLNSVLKDVKKWGFEVELVEEVVEQCKLKGAKL